MMETPSGDVKVLTAGGAANLGLGTSKKTSRKQKKKKKKAPPSSVASNTEASAATEVPVVSKENQTHTESANGAFALEIEHDEHVNDDVLLAPADSEAVLGDTTAKDDADDALRLVEPVDPVRMQDLYQEPPSSSKSSDLFWLFLCFIGIMFSFVCYGLLLEYTTSGGRKLHELSFLFVTSSLYTLTAATFRYIRAETPTTIPPARFAVLGLTSMGSTFCSVRSLRYVDGDC